MVEGFEIVIWPPISTRGENMLKALANDAPPGTVVTNSYTASRRVLMTYGAGNPRWIGIVAKHKAAGGRVVKWDLGYWERKTSMRMSVDGLHPTAEHLAMAPDGPGRREFVLREDADINGPIMLVGLGPKSVAGLGYAQEFDWERKTYKRLKARYPEREILWRPKGRRPVPFGKLRVSHGNPIEEALKGCSLVACRHSNVAVDACVAGVPVECEAGAAFALYQDNPAPSREQRAEFLRRLSFWEWSRNDAPAAWAWIQKVTQ